MIGKRVEFKNPNYSNNQYYMDSQPKTFKGVIFDKITEQSGRVSPAWARGGSGNDVAVTNTTTYYMVAEDKNGKMHRVYPSSIIRLLNA